MRKALKIASTVFETVFIVLTVFCLIFIIVPTINMMLPTECEEGFERLAEIFANFLMIVAAILGSVVSAMLAVALHLFRKSFTANAAGPGWLNILAVISAAAVNLNLYLVCFGVLENLSRSGVLFKDNMYGVFVHFSWGAICVLVYIVSLIAIGMKNAKLKRMLSADTSYADTI